MPVAPSEFASYHVTGPVVLQATVGVAFAWANVGVCENGIELEFRNSYREVKPDGAGGPEGAPANFIWLNAVVVAKCTLVPFAGVYLNRLRAWAQANPNGTDGTVPQSGQLFTSLVGIRFASSDVDGGFWLRNCLVSVSGDFKASPTESKPRLEFTAINAYNPLTHATIFGSVLYSRI